MDTFATIRSSAEAARQALYALVFARHHNDDAHDTYQDAYRRCMRLQVMETVTVPRFVARLAAGDTAAFVAPVACTYEEVFAALAHGGVDIEDASVMSFVHVPSTWEEHAELRARYRAHGFAVVG